MAEIKTDGPGRGAASNSILLSLVRVIAALLGLIVTKLLSVHFSLQEYGTYSQALLVTSTATSVSIFGLTDATNYFYNRTSDSGEQKRYLSTIFSIQYLAGFLCLAVIAVFRGAIASLFSNDSLKSVLIVAAPAPLLTNLMNMYQNLFISVGRAKTIALRNLIAAAIRLCAVAAACFITENIVTVLLMILLLDLGQVWYFSHVFARLRFGITVKDASFALVREIVSFSAPMAVYVLTSALMRDIDKYVISGFSSAEALAIYTNAAKPLPFDLLAASLMTVLVPVITRLIHQRDYEGARRVFKLYLRLGYLITCILAGGAVAVANHMMVFLYDEKYISGLPVFIVYLVIDMIRFANVTAVLSGAGKSGILMLISIAALGANAALNVISYRWLGMMGPALTTLALTVLMTLALLHCGAREMRSSMADLFDYKEMAVIGGEMAVFGWMAHLLADFLRYQMEAALFAALAVPYGAYLLVLFGLNYRKVLEAFGELNRCR